MEVPKNTGINEHAIKVGNDKYLLYESIYSLGPVHLEIFKIYIKTNLKTRFIQPFKSPADASILFNKKSNGDLYLCIDYGGLNNITIKKQYPLSLIGESFEQLGQAKKLNQLDVTNASPKEDPQRQ